MLETPIRLVNIAVGVDAEFEARFVVRLAAGWSCVDAVTGCHAEGLGVEVWMREGYAYN